MVGSALITLDSPIWQRLPNEIFSEILNSLLSPRMDTHLPLLSLVCRQWRERMIPFMTRSLRPPNRIDVAVLVSVIQVPGSRWRNTTQLTLQDAQFLRPHFLHQLSTLLPVTEVINLADIDWNDAACTHSSWGKRLAGSMSGFKHVQELNLRNCKFHSSLDVLLVLSTLPALSRVFARDLEWSVTSRVTPQKKLNQLNEIELVGIPDPAALLYFWALPHSTAPHRHPDDTYRGLRYAEARILEEIFRMHHDKGYLQHTISLEDSPYPHAWTLLIRTVPSFEGPSIAGITTIEVTICQYDDGLPGHVRWVLFRYDDKLSDIFHRDKVHDVGKLLSQLPRLNPIVLDQMNKGYAPPWNWACGKRVEIWTRMDSRLHAISMWNEGVPAVPTVPVSPRFYPKGRR